MKVRGSRTRTPAVDQDAPVRSRLRPAVAAAAALATVLLTAGCSGSPAPTGASGTASPGASPAATSAGGCATSGSASDAVKVVAKGDAAPDVSFPVPTSASTLQRTVVKAGTGDTVKQGATVSLAYEIYDAKSGKRVDTRGYGSTNPVTFTADPTQLLPGLVSSLVCAKEGERFAAVIPAAQAFGSTGSEQLGVGGGDSLVLVGDLVELVPTKATGAAKALPSGFPKVTLAADGTPKVAIPAAAAPKTLKIATSKQGTGDTVKSGDTVTVQYQGTLWRTGKVFDQSWGKGPTSFPTNGVVKGFGDALVGAKVGSQVVAIVPPADGYGSKGSSDGSIKGTDTMVFVIDVLATAHG